MDWSQRNEQQRVLVDWAICALALLVLVVTTGFFGWLILQGVRLIYPVILPLGVAAILAYILEPAVDFLGRGKLNRVQAVLTLALLVAIGLSLLGWFLIPPLVEQILDAISALPTNVQQFGQWLRYYLADHPAVSKALLPHLDQAQNLAADQIPILLGLAWKQVGALFSWAGFALGFLFVPLYVFYFLVEKETISKNWRGYLPLRESRLRDEVILVLSEINKYLVVFFRGQVLIGACIGTLTAFGLTVIGLKYGLLLGLMCGALSLIPYLGVVSSLLPSLVVAWTQTGSWKLPVLVLGVFAIVQACEGLFISPKILGDKTGLHPLTIILAILLWSLVLPGLLGAILAVPLTATLRVLMHRYVWIQATEAIAADQKIEI
jgi:predicted PurR-regulated permease PerM